ncbi:MAG: AbrB/MazE/SpoVT family DNA-binding domain-containing protein [Candidatus Dormibacteraeota bacterium]|uniref:AbrB/MazE/SpoVT family DNA-binding domain-containing protein n=1 Tax=Candidatus Amunia macphersoniae TaxID=3127014 RepID=A0A934KAW9_9BACT|nr:AbrB/MazE/SpoVT family DNA-binding domain-containing protein [Candidatus Dormibacteraeota bacterium]
MRIEATVSDKGQITIPRALRDRLGIRPGDVLRHQPPRVIRGGAASSA